MVNIKIFQPFILGILGCDIAKNVPVLKLFDCLGSKLFTKIFSGIFLRVKTNRERDRRNWELFHRSGKVCMIWVGRLSQRPLE